MHFPKHFWANAIVTAIFLINKMAARIIDYQTPLRMLSHFRTIPSALNLCPKVFGCVCYVHVHYHHRNKLDLEPLNVSFLVTLVHKRGKCFHPPTRKYYVSMDVKFCEPESYFAGMYLWFLFKGR